MSDAGGAAFNAAVRTENNLPEPPADPPRPDEREPDQADNGHLIEEE